MTTPSTLHFSLTGLSLGDEFDDVDYGDNGQTNDIMNQLFGDLPDLDNELTQAELEVTATAETINSPTTKQFFNTLPFTPIQSKTAAIKTSTSDFHPNLNSTDLHHRTSSAINTLSLPNLSELDMKELGLDQDSMSKLKNIFLSLHLHSDGTLDIDGFHDYFRVTKSPWSQRVFNLLDINHTGTANFTEWVAFTSHLCTAQEDGIARVVFSMYDPEHSGVLDTARVIQLLHDVHSGGASARDSAPWLPSFVGEKVGQALTPLPLDNNGNLQVYQFCKACKKHTFILEPIHELVQKMIEKCYGPSFWNNITEKARKYATISAAGVRESSHGGNGGDISDISDEKGRQDVQQSRIDSNRTDQDRVNETETDNFVSDAAVHVAAAVMESTKNLLPIVDKETNSAKKTSKKRFNVFHKGIKSTNWFHRFGLRYIRGGMVIPWTAAPTNAFLDLLVPHHEHKQGTTIQQNHRHHQITMSQEKNRSNQFNNATLGTLTQHTAQHVSSQPLNSMSTQNTNKMHKKVLLRSRIAALEKRLLVKRNTASPPDLKHPKHFYNRIRPKTASNSREQRNNLLKSHIEKTKDVASSMTTFAQQHMSTSIKTPIHSNAIQQSRHQPGQRPSSAKQLRRRKLSSSSNMAYKKLTRTWKKTPCVGCGMEGHLLHSCPIQIKRKKARKIRNRLIMSGMHTRKAQQVGNRILLTSLSDDVTKDHMNQTLMDHITGGMKPKQRAQLLAFAVKKSLVEAVSWADQARYTGRAMENARTADKRHGDARKLKNRKERIKRLKPKEISYL